MAKQENYALNVTKTHGAIVGLGGFMADNPQSAQIEAAKIIYSLMDTPSLEAGDKITIVNPDGSSLGAPADVSEFVKKQ
jgi:hypothetical protein